MKKIFKNFSWKAFWVYAITFAAVGIPIEWLFGGFKEPGFEWKRFIVDYFFRTVFFGFLMSLMFGKKIVQNWRNPK